MHVGSEPGWLEWEYIYQDNAGWHSHHEVAETTGQTSLALDATNLPLFSYMRTSSLWLMRRDAAGWHEEQVDESQDVGVMSSLAIGSDNWPYVAYTGPRASMDVASWTGVEWAIDRLRGSCRYCETLGVSLALDADNQPHVANAWSRYDVVWNETTSLLDYQYRDADGWHRWDVEAIQAIQGFPDLSLALDTSGAAHSAI